tara:strand:+ start:210 stop:482 length:273 start_codon:yes stop_codon:yes gene_type:complete
MIYLSLFFFFWLPLGFFSNTVANSKGYNGISWFFGGVLFGPIALISIVGMPDKTSRKYLKVMAEILDDWDANQNGDGEMLGEMEYNQNGN